MLWIDDQLVPDNISIGDLRILRNMIREFATEHKLTHQEALAVIKMVQLFREEKSDG